MEQADGDFSDEEWKETSKHRSQRRNGHNKQPNDMLRESGDLVEKAMIDVQDSQVEYLQKQLDNESDDDQEQKGE